MHYTGAPNWEGLKGKEETEDGSRLKLGSETQWKYIEHIQSMGRRETFILSLPVGNKALGSKDRVNTKPEKPQEEDCRVQKRLFASNNRTHTAGIIKSLGALARAVKFLFQAWFNML